jgi:hypothetical protein
VEPIVPTEPRNTPLFILSCERSGSTLLRYILDTHSKICSPGELVLGGLCDKLLLVLDRTLGCRIRKEDPERRDQAVRREVRRIIGGIMESYARARGKQIWCDKSPGNLAYLNDLETVFPEARSICLYRNCMDVVHSCLQVSKLGFMPEVSEYVRRSPHNFVAAMIDNWLDKTAVIVDAERRRPSNCFRVRYEDLVCDPGKVLEPLCRFLEVDWEPDLVDRVFQSEHDDGGGDLKIKFTDGLRTDRIGRGSEIPFWTIPGDRLEKMNALLKELGYPVVTSDLNRNPPDYGSGPAIQKITDVAAYFCRHVPARIRSNSRLLKGCGLSLKYVIQGDRESTWVVSFRGEDPEVIEGDAPSDCVLSMEAAVLLSIANSESSMIQEVVRGRVRFTGDAKAAEVANLIA